MFLYLARYNFNQSWVCNSMTERSFCVSRSLNQNIFEQYFFRFCSINLICKSYNEIKKNKILIKPLWSLDQIRPLAFGKLIYGFVLIETCQVFVNHGLSHQALLIWWWKFKMVYHTFMLSWACLTANACLLGFSLICLRRSILWFFTTKKISA